MATIILIHIIFPPSRISTVLTNDDIRELGEDAGGQFTLFLPSNRAMDQPETMELFASHNQVCTIAILSDRLSYYPCYKMDQQMQCKSISIKNKPTWGESNRQALYLFPAQ